MIFEKQTEFLNKIKNTMEGIDSRIDQTYERISELKYRLSEITQRRTKEQRMKRNKESLQEFWDSIRSTNTQVIEVQRKT